MTHTRFTKQTFINFTDFFVSVATVNGNNSNNNNNIKDDNENNVTFYVMLVLFLVQQTPLTSSVVMVRDRHGAKCHQSLHIMKNYDAIKLTIRIKRSSWLIINK